MGFLQYLSPSLQFLLAVLVFHEGLKQEVGHEVDVTVADLLAWKQIEMPPVRQVGATFKKAPKASRKGPETMDLPLQGGEFAVLQLRCSVQVMQTEL